MSRPTTTHTWSNWAGQQRCSPAVVEDPRTESQVVDAIGRAAEAGHVVRAVGSGHSFTDTCLTDDCHIRLGGLSGLLDADRATGLVRVGAGMRLHDLTRALHTHGLALENQGDIDQQTVAGALATGTHGTGREFRNLSAAVVGCRIALADGTVRDLTAESTPDLLRAARVSIGALGVITEFTLRAVPAFRLRKVEEPRPLVETLDAFDDLSAAHDHFELYAFPYAKTCLSFASDRTDEPPAPLPAWRKWLVDDLVANRGLELFSRAGRSFPGQAPRISRTMTRVLSRDVRVDHSHLVFSSERRVRFTEMEYAIPRAHAATALRAVLAMIESDGVGVTFPIELRTTAPDDAFLSTASGRDTAYIAVHQFQGMPYEAYFRAVEAIMDGFGGRPHWGKRHFQTAETLAPRYPEWDRFAAARAELDPAGRFTNDYVRRTLGPPPAEVHA
ncbi:MAG: D-arabinono-1,4-lactone oxidase [Solirubrobacteraceae bacterium]|nr:D-arabinono-1,4-lactone oxidase [Solirubrobacteraceae bacterium]